MRLPLVTERLLLRPKTLEDVDAMLAVLGDPVVMRYVGDGAPRSREQVEEGIRVQIAHQQGLGYSLWTAVERSTGSVVGDCGLMPLESSGPDVELGYRLAQRHWGRGYATEAARAALAFGFGGAGLEEIVAVAYPENVASRRVMEKIGMRHEGLAWHYGRQLVRYAIRASEARS